MLRSIGYLVARRHREDPEEPRDWALVVEAFLRGLLACFSTGTSWLCGGSLQPEERLGKAPDIGGHALHRNAGITEDERTRPCRADRIVGQRITLQSGGEHRAMGCSVLPSVLQPGERVEPAFGAVDAGKPGEVCPAGLPESLASLGIKAAHTPQVTGEMPAADEFGKGELGLHRHAAMDQA